ncbi:MAG: SPOR domain-containing protein [Gemmatimonadales bacterium]
MTGARFAIIFLGVVLLAPRSAGAQSDPRLMDAVRLAQEGHSDSARAVTGTLLAATPPTDSLYPQILYTQAMVANDAGEMRTQLQRIVVEYPASTWADDALLRLVQMDFATHNLSGAARNLEKLRSDYPASPLLPQASYWAGRVYFDQSNPTLACRWLSDGLAQSEGNVELQNQLRYLNQRCAGVVATPVDSAAPPDSSKRLATDSAPKPAPADTPSAPTIRADSSASPQPPAAAGKAVYRVQIAAVGSKAAAADAENKARALGLTVITVHEKNLYKVRAGQYSTRAEAKAAAAGLKVKLGGTPFVVAEP